MPEKAADRIISVDTTKYTKYYHLTYLLSRNNNTMLFVFAGRMPRTGGLQCRQKHSCSRALIKLDERWKLISLERVDFGKNICGTKRSDLPRIPRAPLKALAINMFYIYG